MSKFLAITTAIWIGVAVPPAKADDIFGLIRPHSVNSAAHDWSGIYAGVNVGGGFGDGQLRPRKSPVQQSTTTITVPGSLFCSGNFRTVVVTPEQRQQLQTGPVSQETLDVIGYVDRGFGIYGPPVGQPLTQFYTVGDPVGTVCGVPVFVETGVDGKVRVTQGGPGGRLTQTAPTTTTTTTTALTGPLAGAQGVDPATFAAVAALPGQRINTRISGLIGGVQVGYNYQIGNIVLGAEADLQGADVNGSTRILGFTDRVSLDSFGTVRGRLGYAFDRLLVYGTGGFAYGEASLRYTLGGVSLSQSRLHTGWTAGAGVEYALTPQVSIKVEYKHLDLGPETYFARYSYDAALRLSVETFVAGINYKF